MTDLFQCYNLLKDFISEKLDGDIENFKNYNFLLLENDKKFGRCSESGNGFDPDDTEIARAVYYLLFSNKVHDTDLDFSFSDIGTHKKYRGDTLNTFNTLFGEKLERAVKYSNNDMTFIKEVEQWETLPCCRIFMQTGKRSICIAAIGTHIKIILMSFFMN